MRERSCARARVYVSPAHARLWKGKGIFVALKANIGDNATAPDNEWRTRVHGVTGIELRLQSDRESWLEEGSAELKCGIMRGGK